MNARTTTWLAWSTWLAALLMQTFAFLLALSGNAMSTADSQNLLSRMLYLPGLFAFSTAGAIVASRRRENPIGWLLLAEGLIPAFGLFVDGYSQYTLIVNTVVLPVSALMFFARNMSFLLSILVLALSLLYFPNGRLLSKRWGLPVYLMVGFAVLLATSSMLKPGPLDPRYPSTINPLGITDATGLLSAVSNIAGSILLLLVAASALSIVLRFRHAGSEERTQLKWFSYAAFFMALDTTLTATNLLPTLVTNIMFAGSIVFLPVAIGIAILKYRLYAIDILIRRTVIYGLLTAVLLITYFISVVILQRLFVALTGQRSEIATILSTLTIAALSVPLRSWIQNIIDSRFFRRKYDAAKALEHFSRTARDEVDTGQLTASLMDVVEETMQPERMALWMRSDTVRRPVMNEVKQ